MIDPQMKALIDAPLADACKINLPAGKRSARRAQKIDYGDDIGCPKLSRKEIAARNAKAADNKLSSLFDYYATTDLSARRVAEHLGLYRKEQTGTDEAGKPVFSRVLDVKRAEGELAWRRKSGDRQAAGTAP